MEYFSNSSSSTLKEEYFRWRTEDGNAPFEVEEYSLDDIELLLQNEEYGCGTQEEFPLSWTKTN